MIEERPNKKNIESLNLRKVNILRLKRGKEFTGWSDHIQTIL